MDTITIGGIVIAAAGVLILGQAGLIKTMVMDKWKRDAEEAKRDREEMAKALNKLLEGQQELRGELHEIDLRVTRLETEHRLRACIHGRELDDVDPGRSVFGTSA